MADKEDSSTLAPTDVFHLAKAFLLKLGVTHGEDFIDNQDF